MVTSSSESSAKAGHDHRAHKSVIFERRKKARQEQNRRAQQRFRERRKIAGNEQEHRLKQLEDALYEMLSLYIGLSNVVLGHEVLSTGHTHVLTDLQRSMTRVLEIAKLVNHSEVIPMASPEPCGAETDKEQHDPVPEIASIEVSLPPPNNSTPVSTKFRVDQPFKSPKQWTINAAENSGHNQWTCVEADLSIPTVLKGNIELQPELEYTPASLQCQQLMQKLNFFASRLIEITLSRAYSVLFGAVSASSDEVHRTFGSTLRTRTREQILVDLRWLLGPGKKALPQASGYLWEYANENDAPPRWAGYSSFNGICLEVDSDKLPDTAHQPAFYQPRLLTTLGVVQELSNLRATVIDEDTLEITLGDQQLLDPNFPLNTRNTDKGSIYNPTASPLNNTNLCDSPNESLKIRLSVPLLIVNLSLVAMCAKVGPVYPSNDMAKAVEAAVIMVSKDE